MNTELNEKIKEEIKKHEFGQDKLLRSQSVLRAAMQYDILGVEMANDRTLIVVFDPLYRESISKTNTELLMFYRSQDMTQFLEVLKAICFFFNRNSIL